MRVDRNCTNWPFNRLGDSCVCAVDVEMFSKVRERYKILLFYVT